MVKGNLAWAPTWTITDRWWGVALVLRSMRAWFRSWDVRLVNKALPPEGWLVKPGELELASGNPGKQNQKKEKK